MLVARHLKGLSWPSRPRVKIFLGETAPENLTGEIKKYKPTHLIVIDAIDKKCRAGTIHLFDFQEHELASAGPSSTHNLPMGVLLKYLLGFLTCRITLIGIQPKTLAFNKPPTPAVDRAAKRLAAMLHGAITADV
jgi:hydrogenase 3 maturation protease